MNTICNLPTYLLLVIYRYLIVNSHLSYSSTEISHIRVENCISIAVVYVLLEPENSIFTESRRGGGKARFEKLTYPGIIGFFPCEFTSNSHIRVFDGILCWAQHKTHQKNLLERKREFSKFLVISRENRVQPVEGDGRCPNKL